MWQGLSDTAPSGEQPISESDLAETRRRQQRDESAADLDPAAFQLAVMGMVIAPLLLPVQVRELFGMEAQTTEFERRSGERPRERLPLRTHPSSTTPHPL
jgi:hypothetical protein